MAVRVVVVLIAAFLATIIECRQHDATSANFSIVADRGQSSQNEFSPSPASTRRLIDEDGLIEDGLCRLTTTDRYVHETVVYMLTEDKVTLIEYQLTFANYSHNPLSISMAGAYDAKKWARVTSAHGQTLLSLAFNYGVLSMKTLTLGTETLNVELQDSPPGCMTAVSDQRKIDSVRRLLMRDFDADGPITTVDDGRVCNGIIVDDGGYAKFRHSCCYKNSITGRIECTTDIGNMWLDLLNTVLIIVRVGLVLFGPSLFISYVLSMSKYNKQYVVPLEMKLKKTVCFYRYKTGLPPVSAKRVLDLSSKKGFPKLKKCLKKSNVQLGRPTKVYFPQYDIEVDYRKMQKENMVPVGLLYSICRAIFRCQIQFIAPFKDCCKTKMFYSNRFTITWGKFCKKLAMILLILLLPTPFYMQLIVFYVFECDEVEKRKRAIAVGGLKESLESSLMHYFTPTHGVFVSMYVLYIATAIAVAFLSQKGKDHHVKKIIINSFCELKRLNFADILSIMVSNMVWPLKKFRVFGCCVGIIYWPLAIMCSLIVGTVYLLPTLYLTFRMAYHSKLAAVVMSQKFNNCRYQVRVTKDPEVDRFRMENLFPKWNKAGSESDRPISPDDVLEERVQDDVASIKSTLIPYTKFSWLRVAKYVFFAFLCISTLYSVVIILSEVIGCLVEIIVFTIMGCIVNASALLKYVMLIITILVYCGDYNKTIRQKYLKLNRVLFSEITHRIRDVKKVTRLPSWKQENCAFKADDTDKQADYMYVDDVARKPANHWKINDLVMFVDSKDIPRIPIQLFYDVISNIRVAGIPGPIYREQMKAFYQFSKMMLIVIFIFLAILSFGSVYKISATSQSLATLVGGFLPLMVRTFMAPPPPELEFGPISSVSFKCGVDQIIMEYCQNWPIYDLPFEVVENEDENPNAEAKTDSNDNKSELPTTEESKRDIDKKCTPPIDDDIDDSDRSTIQQLLPCQLSVSNKPVEKSAEDVIRPITLEDQVDIAIYLPKWPEN